DCDEKAGSPDQALGAVLGAGEGFRGDREGGGRGDCIAAGRIGDGGAGEGGARGGDGSAAVDGEHARGMGTAGECGRGRYHLRRSGGADRVAEGEGDAVEKDSWPPMNTDERR